MQIILLDDVEHLGEKGDIHDVADGYGRNYLIPQGLARVATDGAIRQLRDEQRQQARKEAPSRNSPKSSSASLRTCRWSLRRRWAKTTASSAQ